jgi:hypothetical protein
MVDTEDGILSALGCMTGLLEATPKSLGLSSTMAAGVVVLMATVTAACHDLPAWEGWVEEEAERIALVTIAISDSAVTMPKLTLGEVEEALTAI